MSQLAGCTVARPFSVGGVVMAAESDILFRNVGEAADAVTSGADGLIPVSYGFGAVGILVVSVLAVIMIILTTRWSVKSMMATAQEALSIADVRPATHSTTGLGRIDYGLNRFLYVFRPNQGSDAQREAFLAALKDRSDHRGIIPTDEEGEVRIVVDNDLPSSLRQEALRLGFVADAKERHQMTLQMAEALAEREAFDDAIRALRFICAAVGSEEDLEAAAIHQMEVETLMLPPRNAAGDVVKKISITWNLPVR